MPISLALAVSSPTLLPAVFGPSYAASAPVLQILAWTSIFGFQNYLLWYGLLTVHREKSVLKIQVLGLIVNVAVNAWAIPRDGPSGAAAALVASDLVVVIGQVLVLQLMGRLRRAVRANPDEANTGRRRRRSNGPGRRQVESGRRSTPRSDGLRRVPACPWLHHCGRMEAHHIAHRLAATSAEARTLTESPPGRGSILILSPWPSLFSMAAGVRHGADLVQACWRPNYTVDFVAPENDRVEQTPVTSGSVSTVAAPPGRHARVSRPMARVRQPRTVRPDLLATGGGRRGPWARPCPVYAFTY